MSKDGTEKEPRQDSGLQLEAQGRNKPFRGRLGTEGEGACPSTAGAGGARRHRGLPFKRRHRPRPAAAAGTSPLTAATPRSADPTAAAAANSSSCCLSRRPRAAASSPGLGPRPAPPWCPGSSLAWWCECRGCGGARPGRGMRGSVVEDAVFKPGMV